MSDYKEFNELYRLDKKPLTHANAMKTAKLIADELQEFIEEFYDGVEVLISCTGTPKRKEINPHKPPKELTDIRYITGQQMDEYGMDVTALDKEVHRSNMSKTVDVEFLDEEISIALCRYPHARYSCVEPEVYVIKCADTGKVIKPTTYSPAVITDKMIGK